MAVAVAAAAAIWRRPPMVVTGEGTMNESIK